MTPRFVHHLGLADRKIIRACQKEPLQSRDADCMMLQIGQMTARAFIQKWGDTFSETTRHMLRQVEMQLLKATFATALLCSRVRQYEAVPSTWQRQKTVYDLTTSPRQYTRPLGVTTAKSNANINSFRMFATQLRNYDSVNCRGAWQL